MRPSTSLSTRLRLFLRPLYLVLLTIMAIAVPAAASASAAALSPAAAGAHKVLLFHIDDEINSKMWVQTRAALDQAKADEAGCVVIHMNTYGGEVVFADSIRSALLACPVPVYVFINDNAASAGALIATACDSIFMSPGASIGAATVVSGADGEKMPDKYQSYMRGMIRSTAEAHTYADGTDSLRPYLRDPRIAEAFVDESVVVPGLVDSLHVLTLTTREAIANNYCEGIMRTTDEVVRHVAPGAQVVRYEPSTLDNVKGSLLSTWLRGILILVMLGGIYFEMQTPGVGFPIAAAAIAALLFFAPLYIDGLAANWEILMFFLGVILIVLEIFVIPGFGVAGVGGTVCVVASLVLSLLNNDGFSFEATDSADISTALWVVIVSFVCTIALCTWLCRRLYKTRKGGALSFAILEADQEVARGYVGVDKEELDHLVGKEGTAGTDLRPAGKVVIDGAAVDAISSGAFIECGSAVRVISSSHGQIVVEKM